MAQPIIGNGEFCAQAINRRAEIDPATIRDKVSCTMYVVTERAKDVDDKRNKRLVISLEVLVVMTSRTRCDPRKASCRFPRFLIFGIVRKNHHCSDLSRCQAARRRSNL